MLLKRSKTYCKVLSTTKYYSTSIVTTPFTVGTRNAWNVQYTSRSNPWDRLQISPSRQTEKHNISRFGYICQNFTKCCACHERWRLTSPNTAVATKSHPPISNISKDFKKHEFCRTSSKLTSILTAQDPSHSHSQLLYSRLLYSQLLYCLCEPKVRISEVFQTSLDNSAELLWLPVPRS